MTVYLPKYIYMFTARASGKTHTLVSRDRREYGVPTCSHGIWAVGLQPSFSGKENKERNQATEIEKETIGTI